MKKNIRTPGVIFTLLFLVTACASMTVSEKQQERSKLDSMAETAIAGLVDKKPEIQQQLNNSFGYAVANMKVSKFIPLVGGGGGGEGVLVDNKAQQRSYFTVERLDLGGGYGARSFKVLIILNSQEMLDKFKGGTWDIDAGAEAAAGPATLESSSIKSNKNYTLYILSDGGASATFTLRTLRIKINHKLTDKP